MRVLLQPAFILHRRPYRDSSLLLEAFSREYGRLGLIARGAASSRSRLKGVLQPFTPLLLSWRGDGDLATLNGGEEAGRPFPLLQNRALAGLYVNELLVRLLPRRDVQPALFNVYETLLAELATAVDEEPPLRRFEKRLLEELGYGLSLDRTADSGQPIVAEAHYRYVLDRGPLAARSLCRWHANFRSGIAGFARRDADRSRCIEGGQATDPSCPGRAITRPGAENAGVVSDQAGGVGEFVADRRGTLEPTALDHLFRKSPNRAHRIVLPRPHVPDGRPPGESPVEVAQRRPPSPSFRPALQPVASRQ